MRLALLGVTLLLVGCQSREAKVMSECRDALQRHVGAATFTGFTGTPDVYDDGRAVLHGHAAITFTGSNTPDTLGILCTVNQYGAEVTLVDP